MRKEGGGLINQADEEFLFSGRMESGGFRSFLWCEVGTNLLLKDVRLHHAKTAYYLFEKIECKVEMAPGTQPGARKSDSLQIFGRKCHF